MESSEGRAGRVRVEPATIEPIVAAMTAAGLPSRRDLLLQALLHLPRIAARDGTVRLSEARREIALLHAWRARELAPLAFLAAPPAGATPVDALDVRIVPPAVAAPILDRFHYLHSARRDAVNVAAIDGERIAALCSISPLDLPGIAAALPVPVADVAVVSRVFAFDWAPRNAVSYLLARADAVARAGGTRMLITYVNTNMGFTGASYRAANWLPLGIETGTRYAYLDQRYITDRALLARLPLAPGRLEFSAMSLRPLNLLCRLLDRRLRRAFPAGLDIRVARDDLLAVAA